MERYDREALNYLRLAVVSAERKQGPAAVRFLVLVALFACRAGCLELADRALAMIKRRVPKHALSGYATTADALRDEDLADMIKVWEKFCLPEQAEHLLERVEVTCSDRDEFAELAPEMFDQLEPLLK
jgi:hypothetical protein